MAGCRVVYAVASGAYSDYGVSCLFETLELAEQYAARRLESVEAWRVALEANRGGFGEVEYIERFQLWSVVPVVAEGGRVDPTTGDLHPWGELE